jgi:hypothetical protein
MINCKKILDISKNERLTLQAKLTAIARELSSWYRTGIYFCEIKGRRWSFFAGSDELVDGSRRLQVCDRWGIISGHEFEKNSDDHLIINIIKGMLSD